jgi:hypothetical protein
MKHQSLQYYMHDGPTAIRIELAGKLDDEGSRRLEHDWLAASSAIGNRRLIVDITFVTCVGEQGHVLLARWHRGGAQLVANSKASLALAEVILGASLAVHGATAPDRTWLPVRNFAASLLLLLVPLLCPITATSADLKSDTIAAWDNYLQTANAKLHDRTRPGGCFLWTFEDGSRAAKVRRGEIVIAPAPGQNPKRVPGGMIHHWVGAMFVPDVKPDVILQITRDYDHFREFYRPLVIESKTLAHDGMEDDFSMVLMNKAFFLTTALDADYHSSTVRVDDHRFYTVTRTTRVQEVQEFGQPGEHRIPEGRGEGYIWRLYSIMRLESDPQSDGGVYVEIEAFALSRETPAAFRIIVDPIVRRVSRNALLISLEQTRAAVRARAVTSSRLAGISADARQLRAARASLSEKSTGFAGLH